jgi:hypothetical protein
MPAWATQVRFWLHPQIKPSITIAILSLHTEVVLKGLTLHLLFYFFT